MVLGSKAKIAGRMSKPAKNAIDVSAIATMRVDWAILSSLLK